MQIIQRAFRPNNLNELQDENTPRTAVHLRDALEYHISTLSEMTRMISSFYRPNTPFRGGKLLQIIFLNFKFPLDLLFHD